MTPLIFFAFLNLGMLLRFQGWPSHKLILFIKAAAVFKQIQNQLYEQGEVREINGLPFVYLMNFF